MNSDYEVLRELVRNGQDLEARSHLIPWLEYHRLAPLVFHAGSAPALRDAATRAAAADLASHMALREITAALRPARLDFLLFKGTALGHQIYPRSDLRPREDIDVLLDGWGAVERAVELLSRSGWREVRRIPGRFVCHAAAMTRRGYPSVDLHARVSQRHRVAQALPIKRLLRRSVRIDVPGIGAIDTLSPPDALLAGAMHHAAHHGGQEAPLIWLEDLARLAALLTAADWEDLLSRSDEHELSTAFEFVLTALAWWTHGEAPPSTVLARLRRRAPDASAVYVDRTNATASFLDDLLVLDGRSSAGLLRELFFPSHDFLAAQAGVSRARPYPVLWAHRVVRSMSSASPGS